MDISEMKSKLAEKLNGKFLVMEDMNLETDNGNLTMNKGEEIDLAPSEDGNLVVKEVNKLFVINDAAVAEAVMKNCLSMNEEVEFKEINVPVETAIRLGVDDNLLNNTSVNNGEATYSSTTINRAKEWNAEFNTNLVASRDAINLAEAGEENVLNVNAVEIVDDEENLGIDVNQIKVNNGEGNGEKMLLIAVSPEQIVGTTNDAAPAVCPECGEAPCACPPAEAPVETPAEPAAPVEPEAPATAEESCKK